MKKFISKPGTICALYFIAITVVAMSLQSCSTYETCAAYANNEVKVKACPALMTEQIATELSK